MPQIITESLNKTIYGAGLASNASPPDSLVVRLVDVAPDSYFDIYSIDWGIKNSVEAAQGAMDYASLLVLRNELFNKDTNYAAASIIIEKDVVFHDMLNLRRNFNNREFCEPLKLEGAENYLIVFTAPVDLALPGQLYDCILTVRGKRCSRTKTVRERGRVDVSQQETIYSGEED